MATKKEKRARAEAKRAEEMEALRLSGLRAQSQDRARRARIQKDAEESARKRRQGNTSNDVLGEYDRMIESAKGVFVDENNGMPFGQAVSGA